jgi:hypothetical protein
VSDLQAMRERQQRLKFRQEAAARTEEETVEAVVVPMEEPAIIDNRCNSYMFSTFTSRLSTLPCPRQASN